MPDRDIPLAVPGDIAAALALLTRLPVQAPGARRGAAAAWAYPLAGLAVGGLAAVIAALAARAGLPPVLVAGLTLLGIVATTGALHEDGLADTADGLWGGWTRERRLEIMKDSRIGAYGVIALVMSLGLRWAALAAIAAEGGLANALIGAAILSRAPMVVLMNILPNAREGGFSSDVGRPGQSTMLLALGIAVALALPLFGFGVVPLVLILGLSTLAMAAIARAKIGGQTGDILGATQQVSEIVILIWLAA